MAQLRGVVHAPTVPAVAQGPPNAPGDEPSGPGIVGRWHSDGATCVGAMRARPPSPQQIRNALQVGFAGFLSAGIHAAAGPDVNAVDGFDGVYGAARSLLPTPEASRAAAWALIVGAVFGGAMFGGAVVVLLIQAQHNWLAIGIGHVLIQLLGRRLGLSPATLMNAVIKTVLIQTVPAHKRMGGWYVVDRTGWHLLGLLLGMGVERLFWFRSPLERLEDSERGLLGRLEALLAGTSHDGEEELIDAPPIARCAASSCAAPRPTDWTVRGCGGDRRRSSRRCATAPPWSGPRPCCAPSTPTPAARPCCGGGGRRRCHERGRTIGGDRAQRGGPGPGGGRLQPPGASGGPVPGPGGAHHSRDRPRRRRAGRAGADHRHPAGTARRGDRRGPPATAGCSTWPASWGACRPFPSRNRSSRPCRNAAMPCAASCPSWRRNGPSSTASRTGRCCGPSSCSTAAR